MVRVWVKFRVEVKARIGIFLYLCLPIINYGIVRVWVRIWIRINASVWIRFRIGVRIFLFLRTNVTLTAATALIFIYCVL